MMHRAIISSALLALSLPACGRGQVLSTSDTPVGRMDTFTVESVALGEERSVFVGLPEGYDQTDEPYPVLVVLDGESLFAPAAGLTTFMADMLEIPRLLVVGIPNHSRTRAIRSAKARSSRSRSSCGQ